MPISLAEVCANEVDERRSPIASLRQSSCHFSFIQHTYCAIHRSDVIVTPRQGFVIWRLNMKKKFPVQPGFGLNSVPARYLRDLVQRLIELGFNVEQPLASVGLSVPGLNHPEARIDRQQLSLALQALVRATGRSDLGFELGMLANIATSGIVGQLLLTSSTLAVGLERTSQYFALLTPSYRLQVDISPMSYRLICEPTEPLPYDVAFIGLEILAVSTYRMLMFLTQEKSVPATLEVSWPAPSHAARYRELKGLRVRFGGSERPRFVLELAAALVEAPLPMANPHAMKEIEADCRRMLDRLTRDRSWVDWVKTMLNEVEGHFPTQNELADMLRISGRTLARGLAAEGCEYRRFAASIRHERALELISQTRLSLTEIAYRLGYSDAANFSRAFRKTEGFNPGEHRVMLRANARSLPVVDLYAEQTAVHESRGLLISYANAATGDVA